MSERTFWWPLCALSSLARWAQAAAIWACSRRMTGRTSCPSTSCSRPSCSRDSPLPKLQADVGVKTTHVAQQDTIACGMQIQDCSPETNNAFCSGNSLILRVPMMNFLDNILSQTDARDTRDVRYMLCNCLRCSTISC